METLWNLREAGYRLEMPDGRIAPFEEKILASGLCDFALNMTFSNYRGVKRARYDCDGYVSIGELDLSSPEKVFEILEKTLRTIRKAGEFFIDRDKILLNEQTVFYNRKQRNVRIAYFPRESGVPVQQAVEEFMEALAHLTGKEGNGYLKRTREVFYRNNCGLGEMIRVVATLRKDIFRESGKGNDEQPEGQN